MYRYEFGRTYTPRISERTCGVCDARRAACSRRARAHNATGFEIRREPAPEQRRQKRGQNRRSSARRLACLEVGRRIPDRAFELRHDLGATPKRKRAIENGQATAHLPRRATSAPTRRKAKPRTYRNLAGSAYSSRKNPPFLRRRSLGGEVNRRFGPFFSPAAMKMAASALAEARFGIITAGRRTRMGSISACTPGAVTANIERTRWGSRERVGRSRCGRASSHRIDSIQPVGCGWQVAASVQGRHWLCGARRNARRLVLRRFRSFSLPERRIFQFDPLAFVTFREPESDRMRVAVIVGTFWDSGRLQSCGSMFASRR